MPRESYGQPSGTLPYGNGGEGTGRQLIGTVQLAQAEPEAPVAKQFWWHTRDRRSLMTKNKGTIRQGGSKAHQSLKALGGKEGEELVFGRPQEAGQASKKPGTEKLKA